MQGTLGQTVPCSTVQMVTQPTHRRNVITIKIEIGWESEMRVIAKSICSTGCKVRALIGHSNRVEAGKLRR